MFLAVHLSYEKLKSYSETLPPQIAVPGAVIDADFSRRRGSVRFTLGVQENRLNGVYLSIVDRATSKPIRAAVDGSPAQLWDGSTLYSLAAQNASDPTVLPYAKTATLTWDGRFSDGSSIATGSQMLRVTARDRDGNSAFADVKLSVKPARDGDRRRVRRIRR
jgi:hypothetical protein